ncbi:deoxyribose-phosphate aldolase [Hydrogenoanaerobacterium sp.]|uniref:deoxyribose-phosphate aldolase n=1 Tax=Hydrogenoanaerobacterium sp. TaxID=2953763 RepID=UPI00289B042C|nr:deoxyribose-phosphate aldolase [Hydrogenoanaerobacterium sp.]
MLTAKDIAGMIDHSLLNPSFTTQQILEGCQIAREYDCVSVCVRPADVALAKKALEGSNVLTTTVIGFPHGSNKTSVKVFETEEAIKDGAVELDMVMNIGRFLSGEYDFVEEDIRAVCDAAHKHEGVEVKVILETAYLTAEQVEIASKLADKAGCDYVKTSTGYAPGGATPTNLKIMRAATRPSVRIKAAGGVRTLDAALVVRKCGGSRFGCTATKTIMEDAYQREKDGSLKELDDNAILEIAGAQ